LRIRRRNARLRGAFRLLRLALRGFKGSGKPDTTAIRRNMKLFQRITPHPPKRTQVTTLRAGGVPAVQVETPHSRKDCHVLYLHGGGYVYGSPSLYRDFTWRIANATAARVLCIDYRLAPEHPFPAAVDDAVAAYRWMLAEGAEPGGGTRRRARGVADRPSPRAVVVSGADNAPLSSPGERADHGRTTAGDRHGLTAIRRAL
jgi:acetyl esterase/lipase